MEKIYYTNDIERNSILDQKNSESKVLIEDGVNIEDQNYLLFTEGNSWTLEKLIKILKAKNVIGDIDL